MKYEHEDLIVCQCTSQEHVAFIRYDESDPEVYISVHLAEDGFWGRLKKGLQYIFGHRSIYGDFDEILLRPEDADVWQNMVNHLKRCQK